MRGYQQLTRDERVRIETYLERGLSQRQIAARLGRSPSTLSRELRRNGQRGTVYSADAAQDLVRARPCGRPRSLLRQPSLEEPRGSGLWRYVLRGLDQGWSPQLICGRLRLKRPRQRLCAETIYRFIYSTAQAAEKLWLSLPAQHHRRRRHSERAKSRRACDWALPLSARPAAANDRSQFGHWEIDTVCFSKPGAVIVHLVERVSRFGLALLLPGKEALPLSAAVGRKLSQLPRELRRSLSCDRGTEFSKLQDCKLKVYACNPYSAWEKGSVENQNGLLRRYLPRRTDLSTLCQSQLNDIRSELNNRPMKVLGYKTPREVLSSVAKLSVALHL